MNRLPRTARRVTGGLRGHGPWLKLTLFGFAVALFVLAYDAGNRYQRAPEAELSSAVRLKPALRIPQFSANFTTGERFDRAALHQHWSLLLIGPSDTPPVQRALRLLTRVSNRLRQYPHAAQALQWFYLSTDPQHDDDKRLGELQQHYQRFFRAAAASPAALQALLDALGAEPSGAAPALYLIDPQGEVPALFTTPGDAANIARDIDTFVRGAAPNVETPRA